MRYVFCLAILLFYVIRGLKPEYTSFQIPEAYKDEISQILLMIFLIILTIPSIKSGYIKLKTILTCNNNTSRYLALSICWIIIFVKMFFPEIIFDDTSFKVLLIITLLVLMPDIKESLNKIRLKHGDFELIIGAEISKLEDRTTEAESLIKMEPESDSTTNIIYEDISIELKNKLIETSSDPRGSLMILAIEIEAKIRELAKMVQVTDDKRPYPILRLLMIMTQKEYIPEEILPVFRDFWDIRNRVIHEGYKVDKEMLFPLVELGLRILRLLPSKIKMSNAEILGSLTVKSPIT